MDDRKTIDVALVRQLVRSQFPEWAGLRIEPVREGGWDHCTFHLGDEMSVRLPSAARYVAQVEKEQCFLPQLAPRLPLPIPVPLALGAPSPEYPWPWSVLRWIDGAAATPERIDHLENFAAELAHFLRALQSIDATNAPLPGAHNFFRGGALAVYDRETRAAIEELAARLDVQRTIALWERSLASTWRGAPVWVHGDIAPGNLLVRDGRLCGVIDFGACAAGDPACDLVSRMIHSGTMKQRCPESKEWLIAANFCGLNPEGAAEIGQRMKDSGHWPSPGPCSPDRAVRCFAVRCRSIAPPGSARAAGRSGKR